MNEGKILKHNSSYLSLYILKSNSWVRKKGNSIDPKTQGLDGSPAEAQGSMHIIINGVPMIIIHSTENYIG